MKNYCHRQRWQALIAETAFRHFSPPKRSWGCTHLSIQKRFKKSSNAAAEAGMRLQMLFDRPASVLTLLRASRMKITWIKNPVEKGMWSLGLHQPSYYHPSRGMRTTWNWIFFFGVFWATTVHHPKYVWEGSRQTSPGGNISEESSICTIIFTSELKKPFHLNSKTSSLKTLVRRNGFNFLQAASNNVMNRKWIQTRPLSCSPSLFEAVLLICWLIGP